ncbi:hypothetical protein NDU88_005371 [Pleurodeles waltl]|uniref:Uncharacterized protein n=1 Tax=Pleurodeles waltl TaxID=8319 RepID=A0AAV7TU21_PLEWA|nr:hypothetical protein NDU88_005371 [Pleurodeles waltl]
MYTLLRVLSARVGHSPHCKGLLPPRFICSPSPNTRVEAQRDRRSCPKRTARPLSPPAGATAIIASFRSRGVSTASPAPASTPSLRQPSRP